MKQKITLELIWTAIQDQTKIFVKRFNEMDARIERSFEMIEELREDMEDGFAKTTAEFQVIKTGIKRITTSLEYHQARREIQDKIATNHEVKIRNQEGARA